MQTSKSIRNASITDLLQALSDTHEALSSFNVILTDALNENEGYKRHAWGIHLLLKSQISNLAEIDQDLRGWNSHVQDVLAQQVTTVSAQKNASTSPSYDEAWDAIHTKLGADNLERVSRKTGLDVDTIYKVIVTAMLPPLPWEDQAKGQHNPADLRKEFIADKIKEGVDAGQIAQALNLKKQTVERVIGQLLAGQSSQDTEDGQQAVNG